MNKFNIRIVAIVLFLILIATIPITVGKTTNDENTRTVDIGRTFIRGFFFNFKNVGLDYQFFALRIHYTEITGTELTSGIIRMQRCQVGMPMGGYIKAGPFGMFGYMFMAKFKGGIEVL